MFLSFNFSGQNTELLLEYCQKLLDKFNYPWEMMPLMYAILKNANNVEEAERRIDEGKLIHRFFLLYICNINQNNKKLNTKFLIIENWLLLILLLY